MDGILDKHREVWNKKPLIRKIYFGWYKKIINILSPAAGKTLEIGSGTGNFKEYKDDIITSDIEKKPWIDIAFDAHNIPFPDESLANIVMIDVFHHLQNPVVFLNEANRVLVKDGRLVMIEPFPSFFSKLIYSKFHPEPFIFGIDYFKKIKRDPKKQPWQSNQAIPYEVFFKNYDKFCKKFSQKFKVIKREKFSFLLYPLSGGFENKQLYPTFLLPMLKLVEIFLIPFRNLIAFRCFIVLEKV